MDRPKGSLPTCPPGPTTTINSDCWVPHETTRGHQEVVVRTSETQKSFLFEKDPKAELLAAAAADAGLEVVEYSPALVKSTVAGYGRGEKSQVAEMVRLQLRLPKAPTPEDAADALAVAITHWAHARLSR